MMRICPGVGLSELVAGGSGRDHLPAGTHVGWGEHRHPFLKGKLVDLTSAGRNAGHVVVVPERAGDQNAVLEGLHLEPDVALVARLEQDDLREDVGVPALLGHPVDVVVVRLQLQGQYLPQGQNRGREMVDQRRDDQRQSPDRRRSGLEVDRDHAGPCVVRSELLLCLGLGLDRLEHLLARGEVGGCTGNHVEQNEHDHGNMLNLHNSLLIGIEDKKTSTTTLISN